MTGRGLGPANLTPAPNSLEPRLFADDIKISPHRVHRCSQIPTTKCTATMRIRGHLTPPKRAVPNGSNPGNGNKVNLYLSEYYTWALIPNISTYIKALVSKLPSSALYGYTQAVNSDCPCEFCDFMLDIQNINHDKKSRYSLFFEKCAFTK